MPYVNTLLAEFRAACNGERSVDPFSFPEDALPEVHQDVQPIVSTFTKGMLVHIYRVIDGRHYEQYIYLELGDGGIVCGYGGPYASLKAAKKHLGPVRKGWTAY